VHADKFSKPKNGRRWALQVRILSRFFGKHEACCCASGIKKPNTTLNAPLNETFHDLQKDQFVPGLSIVLTKWQK
jgi:hypothetical protein